MNFDKLYTELYAWVMYHAIHTKPKITTQIVQFIPRVQFNKKQGLRLGDLWFSPKMLRKYRSYELDELEGLIYDFQNASLIYVLPGAGTAYTTKDYIKYIIDAITKALATQSNKKVKSLLDILLFFYQSALQASNKDN